MHIERIQIFPLGKQAKCIAKLSQRKNPTFHYLRKGGGSFCKYSHVKDLRLISQQPVVIKSRAAAKKSKIFIVTEKKYYAW